MTVPQPLPPIPPTPPPWADIDLLRDTVEAQARTIRYLLANYESLLKKIEGEPQWQVEWTAGSTKAFAAGDTIDSGWWHVTTAGFQVQLPSGPKTYGVGDNFLAYGTTTAVNAGSAVPINADVIWPPEANGA